jgi:hypothetical protein
MARSTPYRWVISPAALHNATNWNLAAPLLQGYIMPFNYQGVGDGLSEDVTRDFLDHFPVPIRARHQKMCSGGAKSSCTRRLVRILVSLMVLVMPFYPLGRRCDPWCASNQVLSDLRSSSSTTCMSGCIPVVCDTLVEHRRSCIGSSTHYFRQTLAEEELLWEAYAEAVGGHSLISESGPRGLVEASESAHVGVPIFYTGHAHAGSTTLTLWVSWVLSPS